MQQPQYHQVIKNAMREINHLVQDENVDNTALVLWLSAFVPGFVASAIVAGFEYFDVFEASALDESGGDCNSEEVSNKSIGTDNPGCLFIREKSSVMETLGVENREGPKDGK